ncbi:MAG: LysR family transcriptional regulator [Burkholderiaceae bacterium]|nr:LysR family transcriptional regulator [Burkholderiaceae bacterium]
MSESKPPPIHRRAQSVPDLRALETFVVVCDASSMVMAAERLGLSQSAVSQSIKSLEEDLGLQLMDRDVRPARPTHAGRVLHQAAATLLSQAHAAMGQVRAAARMELAEIRLGCVDSFAATVGPPLIRAMAGKARQFRMWSGLTPALAEQMRGRELDMVICTDTGMQDPRVLQRLLFSESWVAVYPKDHAVSMPTSLRDLSMSAGSLPLIRYSQRSVIGQQIERYLRHVGVHAERCYEFDATDPLLSLVASGLGWALTTPLCLWQSRHYLDDVTVVPLPLARLGQRHFFLLSRDGEWSGLDDDVVRVTREVIRHNTAPAIRARIPALPDSALSCPDEEIT